MFQNHLRYPYLKSGTLLWDTLSFNKIHSPDVGFTFENFRSNFVNFEEFCRDLQIFSSTNFICLFDLILRLHKNIENWVTCQNGGHLNNGFQFRCKILLLQTALKFLKQASRFSLKRRLICKVFIVRCLPYKSCKVNFRNSK